MKSKDQQLLEEAYQKVVNRLTESTAPNDRMDNKCEKCKKGTYKEMSQHDDVQGMLTCDKCGNRKNRYRHRDKQDTSK